MSSSESLVAVAGNRYSVPSTYVRLAVTIRLHRQRVRIWHDLTCIADHARGANGAGQRFVDVAHFEVVLARKPRAKVMLSRQVLLDLGGCAHSFVQELSHRHRDRLGPEVLAVYALYERYGTLELLAAMELAAQAGSFSAAALETMLVPRPPEQTMAPLDVPGVPAQAEVDRLLSSYEAWVYVDEAAGDGMDMGDWEYAPVEVLT